jgi:hypothetical protein
LAEYFNQKITDIHRNLDEKVTSKFHLLTVTPDEVSTIIKYSSNASCDLDASPTGKIKTDIRKTVSLSLTTNTTRASLP